jgi:hypothetical protein
MVEIVGYGIGLRPHRPFRIGRLQTVPNRDTLALAHVVSGQVRKLLVEPGQTVEPAPLERQWHETGQDPGGLVVYQQGTVGTRLQLAPGVPDIEAVAELVPGFPTPAWHLRTPAYQVVWPEGLLLSSPLSGAPWPFQFHPMPPGDGRPGSREGVLVMHGPLSAGQIPHPENMIGRGEMLVRWDTTDNRIVLDLRSDRAGVPWLQRYLWEIRDELVVLFSAQSPESEATPLFYACDVLAESLVIRGQGR